MGFFTTMAEGTTAVFEKLSDTTAADFFNDLLAGRTYSRSAGQCRWTLRQTVGWSKSLFILATVPSMAAGR